VVAIANEFLQDAGDQGEGFGVVETDASSETALGEGAGLGYEELVDLYRGGEEFNVSLVRWVGEGVGCLGKLPPSVPAAWFRKAIACTYVK
jgi:hypothetical protein